MARDELITRRAFLAVSVGLGAGASVTACAEPEQPPGLDDPIFAGTCEPEPPPATCTVTAADIEGPYYLPDSPERSDLDVAGDEGVSLALFGTVRDAACIALAGAIVEIWHADPSGAYDDSEAMNYRGYVRTDAEGRYAFTTLAPGRYLNGDSYRPAHIHMKVWREGEAVEALTTQVYFVDDPELEADPWAEDSRTMCLEPDGEGFSVRFDVSLA